MATASKGVTKRNTLNIRIKPVEQQLIDRAAKLRGKTRTDFVLDAARVAAEEAILDQAVTFVSSETYDDFLRLLDGTADPNERLQKTMKTTPPWDKS